MTEGKKPLFLATSLSPNPGLEDRQRSALESWKKAGFQAISLNFPEEIAAIGASYGSLVEARPVSASCTGCQRRRLVAIADLIEASFELNQGQGAFVFNADILLAPEALSVLRLCRKGVTMIPRWQINRPGEAANAEMDPWGYDGVFLAPEMQDVFRNRAFGLGLPWWDYWIPFRALHLGHQVDILREEVAFHIRHEEQWNEEDRARLAGEVWREVDVPPWKRLWRKHFGPKGERKIYGYHNHLAGYVRERIRGISMHKTATLPRP